MPVSWFTTGSWSGSGFGTLRAAVALAAGINANLNPGAGWPTNYGRLILTAAAAASLTGLLAGVDGQPLIIVNNDPATDIPLTVLDASSLAANQFLHGGGDLILTHGGEAVQGMYDATLHKWVLT